MNDLPGKRIVNILSKETGTANESEKKSWKESLPRLAKILEGLPDRLKNSCEICLEAGYQSDERADAVIVGRKGERAVVIIIENKQWSNLHEFARVSNMCLRDPFHDNGYVDHPCHQVSHYKYLLDNLNAYCQENDTEVTGLVFMHNATEDERRNQVGPFDAAFADFLTNAPIFVGEDGTNDVIGHNLREYIEDKLDGGEDLLATRIYSSERRESELYRNTIASILGSREQLLNLLDEIQIAVVEEIRQSVLSVRDQNERTVFIVEGDPGSGKTFTAEALLAYLYNKENRMSAKILLKNKDARRALLRDGVPRSAVGCGLTNDYNHYDCLIYDEAHRMPKQVFNEQDDRDSIEVIIDQSKVSVFFYDSKQRVHVNDYITVDRIIEKAREMNIPEGHIIKLRLEHQHRCQDSDHFMKLIDRILYEPERGLNEISAFDENETYQVRMVDTPRELFYKIKELNDNRTDREKGSRVVAGKGKRTDGRDWMWMDGCRTVGPFRNENNKYVWNRSSYPEPESFASDDDSVNLVGCLDTCQGLDFEYVGVIFSSDIIYDRISDMVRIDVNGHQTSDINLDIDHHLPDGRELLETLIKNTYRVLASRGKKGCFIYCCDEGLQNYLGRLIPTLHVDVPDDYNTYPVMYIGNCYKKIFHTPRCKYAQRNSGGRIEFVSRQEALSRRYRPCQTCNP